MSAIHAYTARPVAGANPRAGAPRVAGSRAFVAKARRSGRSSVATRARGANFDPNDPMTWNAPAAGEGDDEAFFQEMGAPVEDLMQLSDEQLGQLLGQEGVQVPIMIDDDDNASADAPAAAVSDIDLPPATAGEAINKGLALYKSGDYPAALAAFTNALDLPGTGPSRSRKARVTPAGPSQGFADASVSLNEQIAVHYNCACCHARMDDPQAGLVSLVRALECGYDDYKNIRSDPDVASLRADARFEGIMGRFEPQGVFEGVFSMLSKGTTAEQRKKGGAPKGGGGAELIEGLFQAFKDKK